MTTIQSILSRLTKAVGGTEKMLYTEPELNKFAEFYLDKWDENTSEDVIAESFTDFWWDTDRACRRCSERTLSHIVHFHDLTQCVIVINVYDIKKLREICVNKLFTVESITPFVNFRDA